MKRLTHYIIAIALTFCLTVTADPAQMLIPVGQVVGLELVDNTVTVASFDEKLGQAAKEAGLQVGDRILSVNGQTIQNAEDVKFVLDRADGPVELAIQRNKKSDKLFHEKTWNEILTASAKPQNDN